MKTILIPTDFSPTAENAAKYAVQLARHTKAGVKLLHAIKVPAETTMAAQVAWPLEDYQTLKSDSDRDLKLLANRLSLKTAAERDAETQYQPQISYDCRVGDVDEAIVSVTVDHEINLIVMGLWDTSGISRLLAGSNSNEMIEKTSLPLLFVPTDAKFKPIKTIAFATDLSKSDIGVICSLATMARFFNAELLLIHVLGEDDDDPVTDFLTTVTNKANYPNIYYRGIIAGNIDEGLHLLLEHREIEMLVMVHRKHSLLGRLFGHSHTEHMAHHSSLPLLIFPAGSAAVAF